MFISRLLQSQSSWAGAARSAAARGLTLPIAAVVALLTTGYLLRRFGQEPFAEYALMVSLIAVLPFADLGIGAAVVNATSIAEHERDRDHAVNVVAGAIRALCVVCMVFVIAAAALSLSGSWRAILGDALSPDANLAVFVCVALFAFSLPLSVCQRVAVGVGANDKQIVLLVVQPILTLILVLLSGVLFDDPSLAFVAFFVSYAVTMCINVIFANKWSQGMLAAAATRAAQVRHRLGVSREITSAAVPMSAMMIGIPLVMQTHRIMLSNFGTAAQVAQYSLAAQIFIPVTAVAAAASTTLWPFFARARGQDGPGHWSTNPFVFAIAMPLAALMVCGVLTAATPWLGELISGGAVELTLPLGVAYSCFVIAQVAQSPLGVYLTDVAGLRFQAVLTVPLVVVVWLTAKPAIEHFGAAGPLWTTAAALVVLQIIPFSIVIARRQRSARLASERSPRDREVQPFDS